MDVFCFAAHRNGRGVLIPPRYPTFPPFRLSFPGTHLKPLFVSPLVFHVCLYLQDLFQFVLSDSVCSGGFRAGESTVVRDGKRGSGDILYFI